MVVRALSLGKPLVVSDVGWFSELPDAVAAKVPVDELEVETLAAVLELLAGDDGLRRADGRGCRRVRPGTEHDLGHVADLYVEALEEIGGGSNVRDAVVKDVARAAHEVGIDAERPRALGDRRAGPRGRPWQLSRGVREGEFGASRFERVVRERSLAVPLLLSGALLLAFVVRLVLAHGIATPWIMVDELTYSELAKNFAERGEFLLRDQASPFYNLALPGADRAGVARRSGRDGLRRRAGDQRRADGAAAVPVYLLGEAPDVAGPGAASGGSRPADAVADLQRDADDRERVLRRVVTVDVPDRADARAADAAPPGARARPRSA